MPWWIIIGFLILLVLGTFITLYYLKSEWFEESEGFQTAAPDPRQIYLIRNANGSGMTYTDAFIACDRMGGRLAIATEVYKGAVAGINLNQIPGWIAGDQTYGYCPVPAGQSLSGVNGPAIVRYGAEVETNCDGNYTARAPNAAICYGMLPPSNSQYTIYPNTGTFVPLKNDMLNATNLSTVFDKVESSTNKGSYTLLDLDAINIQKSIIIADMESMNKEVYDSEKELIRNLTENFTTSISENSSAREMQIHRIQSGYVLGKHNREFLESISKFFSTVNFVTDPLYPLINTFTIAAQNNTNINFSHYCNMLLSNINYYYLDIINKINLHPVGYINSGVLNTPSYINSAGLVPLQPANSWEYWRSGSEIRKRRAPPYAGCGTVEYLKGEIAANNFSFLQHCPGGKWWRDIQVRTFVWETCPPGYTKPAYGGSTNCYLEYPQLDNKITARDIYLIQQSAIKPVSYSTKFLSGSNGWVPTATYDRGRKILTKFIADKTAIAKANPFNIPDASISNTYRWKPITYLGTLTDTNKQEAKESAMISALFNFTDTTSIEYQIRISSTPPFDLYYSKLTNARPEYVSIINSASLTNKPDVNLLLGLTIAGAVTGIVASATGMFVSRGSSAGATAAKGGSSVAKIATAAKLAGGALAIGAGIAMSAATGLGDVVAANIKLAASNADYNGGVCTKFTNNEFDLLPYQTRQFISIWSIMRKQRVIDWFADNVYRPIQYNSNPPEGPYKDSPQAANTARIWQNGTGSLSTMVGTTEIRDISANIFGTGNPYRLSESPTINSLDTYDKKKNVYNAMAQTYYEKNNRNAYITKIFDVYQIGTTLYDVRFSESRRSGTQTFIQKITDLNTKYNKYRYMQISETQLNNLEMAYSSTIEKLYKDENDNLADSAQNCGVKAQYIKITKTGAKPFNFAQVIAINNYGQNVALSRRVTASSIYLAPYENKTGQVYYDSNYNEYAPDKSKLMADIDNSGTMLQKLSALTDGTYIPRYNSFYTNLETDTSAYITIDFNSDYDISLVTILYDNIDIADRSFKVQLLNERMDVITSANPYILGTNNTKIFTDTFTCDASGSTTVYFLRSDRDINLPACPTTMYSQFKVGRFFASGSTYPITFGAYADGVDAATTFNPLYNAGFAIDMTSRDGNINYSPVIVFNRSSMPVMDDCGTDTRIKTIFKDHHLFVNSGEFRMRSDINGLVDKYNESNTYKPAIVTSVANASADKSKCAYVWKENVYDENGAITPQQVERFGIFNYMYDTENWISRGVVVDLGNSLQYSVRAQLVSALAATGAETLRNVSKEIYVPYKDSKTLATIGEQCPQTDCADPAVINSIIGTYNNYPSITEDNKILRVTKAVTAATDTCEYEVVTLNSMKSSISIQVDPSIDTNTGVCSYFPRDITVNGINKPRSVNNVLYLSADTPLLAKAYNYASDSIKASVDNITYIYSELYNKYLLPQIDSTGEGIMGDLFKYRNTTNTAAGILRNVSVIGQPVVNESGVTCTTECNSPEIIQSFFGYYNNTGGERVKKIRNVGMDASGNCDFTYESAPVIFTGGTPALGDSTTRAVKFKISRHPNSCAYRVDGTPAMIMPTADLTSIMSFNHINVFGSSSEQPAGSASAWPSGKPSGWPSGASFGQPINNAQLFIEISGNQYITAANSPFEKPTTLIENIDYINCLSKYALNSIYNLGLTGSVSGVSQIDAKKCAVNINGAKEIAFAPQSSVITGTLVATAPTVTTVTPTAITPLPLSNYATLSCTPPIVCSASDTKNLTGLSNYIVGTQQVSDDTCEYKITANNTLPFGNTFQRVSFYRDTDTIARIKSISSSSPLTSKYGYFKNITPANTDFITKYMNLLQSLRYSWNEKFYSATPQNTMYWKIGTISKIGIIVKDDTIVFEATSSLFGRYGPLDIREYSAKRYFKFTPRVNTLDGIDPNNYTVSPYTINNISIYKSEDFAALRPDETYTVFADVNSTQNTQICTYGGKNYNTAWYDLARDTGIQPQGSPPSPFIVREKEAPLTDGYYNRVRFTVNAARTEGRAEITRIMFYEKTLDSSLAIVYRYEPIPNAIVELQDISSNYLLIQSGKAACNRNYKAIVDPETTLVECIYLGSTSREYTQSIPCNTGDTQISVSSSSGSQEYKCLNVTQKTYTKPANVACGIGYIASSDSLTCTLVGDFQTVTEDPQYNLFNLNQAIGRLRLELNKSMTIMFNKTINLAGFSFITGSAGTVPLKWTLEGSINGETWRTIHCQSTPYVYTGARVAAATSGTTAAEILSFFTPGIFLINQPGSSGTTCNVATPTTVPINIVGNYYNSYNQILRNITEGFESGPTPSLDSIFTVPLKQDLVPSTGPVNSLASANQIQILKFKILETYDPESKFVHMASLDFVTGSGKIPASSIKLSNLQGSRSSPKEGVTALLEGPQRRWVDYNKSDIIIQFVGKRLPIRGFRFAIPQGVSNAAAAMPIQWVMYGSYDRKNWITLHEFNGDTLPLINSFATSVFKFTKEI